MIASCVLIAIHCLCFAVFVAAAAAAADASAAADDGGVQRRKHQDEKRLRDYLHKLFMYRQRYVSKNADRRAPTPKCVSISSFAL